MEEKELKEAIDGAFYEKGREQGIEVERERIRKVIDKVTMSEDDAKILINSESVKVKDKWIIVRDLDKFFKDKE